MTSRIPPSRRDPQYAPQRTARALAQRAPGTGRVALAQPVLPGEVSARLRGRPAPAAPAGGGGPRTASLVIAAADTIAELKSAADVVCTGTADHTAIQNALDGLVTATHASVLLLPGNYYFTGRVNFWFDDSSIAGPGAVVHVASATAFRINGGRSGIRDLTILTSGTNCRGVDLWGNYSWADGLRVVGTTGGSLAYGIDVSADDVRVQGCHLEAAYTGVSVNDDRTIISDCHFIGCAAGVNGFGGANAVVHGNTFFGAVVGTVRGDAVFAPNGGGSYGWVITGNYVEGHYIGLDIGARASTITGNVVRSSRREGILAYGSDIKVADNIVTGSSQETTDTYANIKVQAFGSSSNYRQSVLGNTCRAQNRNGNGSLVGLSAKYGLEILTGATDVFVSHNDLLAGGATSAYSDAGTGTVIAAANRT